MIDKYSVYLSNLTKLHQKGFYINFKSTLKKRITTCYTSVENLPKIYVDLMEI